MTLIEVERRASALLDAQGLHTPSAVIDPKAFADFLARHTVIVALHGESPIGYVAGRDLGDLYWLAEIGVDPAFARRGLGRLLVRAICDEARALFHRAIGLTTYRDVPFNAPFYERCGFLTVSRQAADDRLAAMIEAETPAGARVEDRVAMLRWL